MQLEKIMNTVYSFAAAVVIFGAWAKLEHKDYGSIALTAGLLTEVAIFFLYGILEWGKQPEAAKQSSVPPSVGGPVCGTDPEKTEELTSTLKHTNQILHKVFRTE